MVVTVRKLGSGESRETFATLGEIHRQVIDTGFLSTLGPKFLTTLYETLAVSDASFTFVAEGDGRVLGFIVGALDTGRVYKEFARRGGVAAAFALAPKLLSPSRLRRILETVLYPKRKQEDDLPEPEILNFCVVPESQGAGVGSQLFAALCDELRRLGVPAIRIVTGETQVSAQRFYEKHGATLARKIEIHKGVGSKVYVYDLPSNAPVS